MALSLVSPFSKTTNLETFPTIDAAVKAANALADSKNTSIVANVIVDGKKMTVPGYQSKGSSANSFLKIAESKVGSINDAATTARLLASKIAAEKNVSTTVEVAGKKFTAVPPARPSDLKNAGKGKPGSVAGTGMKEPNLRAAAIQAMEHAKKGSNLDENDTKKNPEMLGSSKFERAITYNLPREVSGKIPTMEGLLGDIPGSQLKGVLGSLPKEFKSLLPIGALPGILKQSPIPLNNLLNIASGKTSSVAGQAVGSLSRGVAVTSGLARGLSSIPFSAETGKAVLSNVIGATLTNIAVGNSVKILVPHVSIAAMSSVSLNSANVPHVRLANIPSDPAFSTFATLISGLGGRVPLRPTNLSIGIPGGVGSVTSVLGGGALGAVSGIAQSLSSFDVGNIFSPSQLTSALPKNISNLLSSGRPPRSFNPGAMGISPKAGMFTSSPNDIESRRKASPAARTVLPTGGARPPVTPPTGSILKNGQIDYGLVISPGGRTLGELVHCGGRRTFELPPKGALGYSLEQIVEGLKYLATNVLDPLDSAYGKATVESGYRGPGGTNYGTSDHSWGGAVDLTWNNAGKHYEIAQFVDKNIKCDWVCLFFKYNGDVGSIHINTGPRSKFKEKPKTTFQAGAPDSFKDGIVRPSWI